MVAARSARSLERRNFEVEDLLNFDHVLPFIDGDTSISGEKLAQKSRSPFAAHVHLKSTLPTLLLEEHEDILESVSCYDSLIELEFYDAATLSTAWAGMQKRSEMLVITSHAGCNAKGEREPFLITKVDKKSRSLVLTVTPSTFKKSFHSIDVSFGAQGESAPKRHDQELKKRQAPAGSSSTTAPSVAGISSLPTATKASATFSTALAGATILPPSFPGSDSIVPGLPAGLTVVCKDCSLQGSIDLSDGVISTGGNRNSINSSGDAYESDINEIVNFLDAGYFDLTVNNFAAHVELETTAQPSGSLITHTVPFPDVGIPGWVIPKIAEVGPVLRPQLVFGIALSTTLTFTYGFDISIPSPINVHLSLADPTTLSTASSFQSTKLTPLPFQSQHSPFNLTISVAFQPELLLTVALLSEGSSVAAGAFFDIPRLSATISELDQCPAPASSSSPPFPTTSSSSNSGKGHYLNIQPEIELDTGVLVNANLALPNKKFSINEAVTKTLASTAFPLPTTCLSFDGGAKSYKAVETGASTGTGTGSTKATGTAAVSGNGASSATSVMIAYTGGSPGATGKLKEFLRPSIPAYGILSHRWEEGEITFKDVSKSRNLDAPGWEKLHYACKFAKERFRREWLWMDTCCIDKKSSAELSEAVNSMYMWYAQAEECYAYLNDVPFHDRVQAPESAFRKSAWFTRAWTLQELLAPSKVYFIAQDWGAILGMKVEMSDYLFEITGIDRECLAGSILPARYSIAQRMSWASRRQCTREEDTAYSIIGLFGVAMPLIYGEGEAKAFRRLQLELINTSNDETVFAWPAGFSNQSAGGQLLARRPLDFAGCANLRTTSLLRPPYQMTNKALQIYVKSSEVHNERRDRNGLVYIVIALNCHAEMADGGLKPMARLLYRIYDISSTSSISNAYNVFKCAASFSEENLISKFGMEAMNPYDIPVEMISIVDIY
ncbi:uncharacterized protein KY384_006680 [Bacidia gigantensis]|uniref:uncharacterized protein n=1 Tax=Bacidia gigantensis TaxID=2732470 RepID=UPI001D0511BE|nr:uncharacterized protein KY384_006680 [Bacidia gigantensis]KAG8528991.1 hypothetical protein KY384_006680 [Bacidia gigantensis]